MKETITYEQFDACDLRVGTVVVAELVAKSRKLLRLEIDLGEETRQIVAGIQQFYTPEELVGRQVVVIVNLAPRTLAGLESQGMLLAACHGDDDHPVALNPMSPVPNGSAIH